MLAGLASIGYVIVPSMWVSLSMVLFGTAICGLRYNAINSLSLEQVPEHRGSMMSMNSASVNLGMALGAGIGGYFLLVGDWVLMGVLIGALGLLAAGVLQVWAVD
jgi:predicted MFS family arabinose efflux permease